MAPQEDRHLLVGGSSSYGALTLPASGAESAKRNGVSKAVGITLLAIGVAAIAAAAVSSVRTGSMPKSAVDVTLKAEDSVWESRGPLRPTHFSLNPAAANHEREEIAPGGRGGLWKVTQRNDYLVSPENWDIYHEGSPEVQSTGNDGSWRFGYKWAITPTHVSADGWGPCYPACGKSIQFRTVVCIRSDESLSDDIKCESKERPQLHRSCFNYSECHPCWSVSEWTACDGNAMPNEACHSKSREVTCTLCEPESKLPADIPAPINSIRWPAADPTGWAARAANYENPNYVAEGNPIDAAGVAGSVVHANAMTFASELNMDPTIADANEHVCLFGGVGICDFPIKEDCNPAVQGQAACRDDVTMNRDRKHTAYFCGFEVAPEDCTKQKAENAYHFGDPAALRSSENYKDRYNAECNAKGHHGDNEDCYIMGGYQCNVMSKPLDPVNTAFLDQAGQHISITCDGSAADCIDWVSEAHGSYGNRNYHMVGPFETEPYLQEYSGTGSGNARLKPATQDNCINFCDVGKYGWWYPSWENEVTLPCFNETWFHDTEERWIPRLEDDKTCMDDADLSPGEWNPVAAGAPEDLVYRPQAPQEIFGSIMQFPEEEQDCQIAPQAGTEARCSGAHNEMTCGDGHRIRPHRCCRIINIGVCEDTGTPCYCNGAHTIFRAASETFGQPQTPEVGGPNYDISSQGWIHEEIVGWSGATTPVRSYCPMKLDGVEGHASHMFSYLVDDNGRNKGVDAGIAAGGVRARTHSDEPGFMIPIIRRESCMDHQATYECERYPNVNPNWPPDSYLPGVGNDETEAIVDPERTLLVQWIDSYESCYDPTVSDMGIAGYDTGRDGSTGCDPSTKPYTCRECTKLDYCRGIWQCNCWRSCNDDSVNAVTSKNDTGYVLPRDPLTDSFPPNSLVNRGLPDQEIWEHVQEANECEECPATCGMTAERCRQCWCEYLEFEYWVDPEDPTLLPTDGGHISQYANSMIDPTGVACYSPWTGQGSPPPETWESCDGPDGPHYWRVVRRPNDLAFGWSLCQDSCGPSISHRELECVRGCDGAIADRMLCEPNPLGDAWELIMQIGDEVDNQEFWFGAQFWQDPDSLLNDACVDSTERKMEAFNAMKFNLIKMCFGYGFEVANGDFEEQELSAMTARFTSNEIDGWTLSGAGYALMRSSADAEAASGLYLAGLYGGSTMYATLGGLSPGLLTTIEISLASRDVVVGASLLISDVEYLRIADVPAGGMVTYSFAFTPVETSVSLGVQNIAADNGDFSLLVDNIQLKSQGFEIVAQEPGGSQGGLRDLSIEATAAAYGDTELGGQEFNIGPSREFQNDWDEVMIIYGDSHETRDLDGDGSMDTYYIFKPSNDIFGPTSPTEDITINDVRTNDDLLAADIARDGGAKMCRQPDGQQAFWSLNGLMDGATMDPEGGCARTECSAQDAGGNCETYDYQGRGVYYAGSSLDGGFVGNKPEGQPKGYTAGQWESAQQTAGTLQIFVRKTNAHGAEDETQANCIVYRFNAMAQNATVLFNAGELIAGGSDEVSAPFFQREFSRVFSAPPANADGVTAMERPGFNIGIQNWECDAASWGYNSRDDGYNAVFVRWGYVSNIATQDFVDGSQQEDDMDEFVGIGGLRAAGGDCHGEEAANPDGTSSAGFCGIDKIGAGWSRYFLADNNKHVQKAWLWVADSTTNPGIDGFKELPPYDWNEPGYKVLDGAANLFDTVDGCKRKCAEMGESCQVGVYVSGTVRHGQCWLASKKANTSDTSFCDPDLMDADHQYECKAFEKKPSLTMRSCSAYVYESHMVLPGGTSWDYNKFFETGVVFEVKEGVGMYSDTIFGPVTTREVISKQFSYGRQTYVYWSENVVNDATLRSKCVATQARGIDKPKFVHWPGKISECMFSEENPFSGANEQKRYNSVSACHDACLEHMSGVSDEVSHGHVVLDGENHYGSTGESAQHSTGGKCHGISEWLAPNVLMNPGFDEFFPEEEHYIYADGAASVYGWSVTDSVAIETKTGDDGAYPRLALGVQGNRFLDLNNAGAGSVSQTFRVKPETDYVITMWVSGDYACQGNADDPVMKTARVLFDGNLVDELSVDVTGWDASSYQWKKYAWEVTSSLHVAELTIQSTNSGCGGVMIDQVDVRMAHAGDIDGTDHDGQVGKYECAQLDVDFTVEAVTEVTQLGLFGLRDRHEVQSKICANPDNGLLGLEIFPAWYDCHTGLAGVITNRAQDRRYSQSDTQFTHSFGGCSQPMDQLMASNLVDSSTPTPTPIMTCTSFGTVTDDPMAPWRNPGASADQQVVVFAGPQAPVEAGAGMVTVFTYRLTFDHIAQILNIKVVGSKFKGSVFSIATLAKKKISEYVVNSADGHFSDTCDECGDCEVIVPGTRQYALTQFFFEEQSDETFGRIRASFCVRTPVCLLHGEHETATHDPHTGLVEDGCETDGCECTDGLLNHLNSLEKDFVSQIVEPKCQRIEASEPDVMYSGNNHLGDTYSLRFSVEPRAPAHSVGEVKIGLYDHQQKAQRKPSNDACSTDPAYYITIQENSATLHQGWPTAPGSTLLATNDEITGLLSSDLPSAKYFWVDAFFNAAADSWSIRVGRQIVGDAGKHGIDTMVVGADVFLQYDLPADGVVLPVSHFAVNADTPSNFNTCTHTDTGMPASHRACLNYDCPCRWMDPCTEMFECTSTGCTGGLVDGRTVGQCWDEIPCSNQCGDGQKERPTRCMVDACEANSVLGRIHGSDCEVFRHPKNQNCRVQFFTHHGPHHYGESGVDLDYVEGDASRIFTTGEQGNLDDASFTGSSAMLDNTISTMLIEGPGCAIVAWDSKNGDATYQRMGVVNNENSEGYLQYLVPADKEKLVVLFNRDSADMAPSEIQENTEYVDLPDSWDEKISSIIVARINPEYCMEDEKPVTVISCHEERGCCWVAAYGQWSAGEGNMVEGTTGAVDQTCMNLEGTCEPDQCGPLSGLTCRDISFEKRKYRCAEWVSAEGVEKWGDYYLNQADTWTETRQALIDWGDQGEGGTLGHTKPICKNKQYVETLNHEVRSLAGSGGKTRKFEAYMKLTRWQYSEGCPEPNHGGDTSGELHGLGWGVVMQGSDMLETASCDSFNGDTTVCTNMYRSEAAGLWECSGDAYWWPTVDGGSVIGGAAETCGCVENGYSAERVGYSEAGGACTSGETIAEMEELLNRPPQMCKPCWTPEWHTCHWHADEWSECSGCGDVMKYRKVVCRRCDFGQCNEEAGECTEDPYQVSCTQSVLDTYGKCCYNPNFYSHCGGCSASERPTTAEHCADLATDRCTYEWHVKVAKEKCDTFSRCVPWSEWTVDERSSGSDTEQREWCIQGPERTRAEDAFVTYGLGACWFEDTRQYHQGFTTANTWQAQGNSDSANCACYYGGKNSFGQMLMGPEALRDAEVLTTTADSVNKRVAALFELENPAWVQSIMVGASGAGATLKGAIYRDDAGTPGTRIGTTSVADSPVSGRSLVELSFVSPENAGIVSTHSGVYLAGGRYWLSVNVGGSGTDLVAVLSGSGAEETLSHLVSDEVFGTGNDVPAYRFGTAYRSFKGSFTIYAAYEPDNERTIHRTNFGSCQDANTCDECLQMQSNVPTATGPCVYLVEPTQAGAQCVPRVTAMTDGLTIDRSCEPSWGLGLFSELQHWSCTAAAANEFVTPFELLGTSEGQHSITKVAAQSNPNQVGPAWAPSTQAQHGSTIVLGDDDSQDEDYDVSVEQCAEMCQLADVHWYGWAPNDRLVRSTAEGDHLWANPYDRVSAEAVIPEDIPSFSCNAFTYNRATRECTVMHRLEAMESVTELTDGSVELSASDSLSCYVPNEVANPCLFSAGEWIRASDGEYYYVGLGELLYKVERDAEGNLPSCDGSPIFGEGFSYDSGPERFCNGFHDDSLSQGNPSDATCAQCLDHMISHQMVAGAIDGTASGCGNLGTATVRSCQDSSLTISCVRGAIHIDHARYGRFTGTGPAYCPESPFTAPGPTDASSSCGVDDNVLDQMQNLCNGKGACSLQDNDGTYDATLTNQDCPTVYKYLEVEYTCVARTA
jgi:hypothetical protein